MSKTVKQPVQAGRVYQPTKAQLQQQDRQHKAAMNDIALALVNPGNMDAILKSVYGKLTFVQTNQLVLDMLDIGYVWYSSDTGLYSLSQAGKTFALTFYDQTK